MTKESIKLNVRVKPQDDGRTCGACAVYAITRYHKLDLTFADVRGVLGTDHSLTLFPGRRKVEQRFEDQLEGRMGTLPVDVFFTLWAFGFTPKPLSLRTKAFRKQLKAQLEDDNPVLALCAGECGLHWIVINGITPKGIQVAESLEPDRSIFWHQEKVDRELLGAITAIPKEDYLIPAMARSAAFHAHVATRLSKVGIRTLTGRGIAA